jgi:hypothetical protein
MPRAISAAAWVLREGGRGKKDWCRVMRRNTVAQKESIK